MKLNLFKWYNSRLFTIYNDAIKVLLKTFKRKPFELLIIHYFIHKFTLPAVKL